MFNLFVVYFKSVGTSGADLFKNVDSQIHTNYMFQKRLHISLYFQSISVMNKGSEGSFLINVLRVPEMFPKNIGIHPEA